MKYQEEKEKNARLTNDKVKDNYTKKLFSEEKEILDKRISEQDILIDKLKELVEKMEIEKDISEQLIVNLFCCYF